MTWAKNKINNAFEKGAETSTYVKAYLDYQIKLKKLEASKAVGKSLTSVAQSLIIGAFIFGVSLFGFMAGAMWLADLLGSYSLAFLIVAGVILLFLILFILLRRAIVERPMNQLASQTFFQHGLPADSEITLRKKIEKLEEMIAESSQDIPESISDIKVVDFLPTKLSEVGSSGLLKGATNFLSGQTKNTLVNIVGKLLLKSISKNKK